MTANQETVQFWFGLGKDLITACVSIAAVVIAWKGLTTWRRQLYGQNTFEAARKLGGALRQFKDELHYFRSPIVYGHEIAAAEAHFGLEPRDPREGSTPERQLAPIRWKQNRLVERWNDVALAAYDAELLFGDCVNEPVKACRALVHEVDVAILKYSFALQQRGQQAIAQQQEAEQVFWGVATDEFGTRANAAIAALGNILTPYLRPFDRKPFVWRWPWRKVLKSDEVIPGGG